MQRTAYCICGASVCVTAATPKAVESFIARWRQFGHEGPGHGPCTRKACMEAKRRKDEAGAQETAKRTE